MQKKERQQSVERKVTKKNKQTYETYVVKIQCILCLTRFYSSQGRWDMCDNAETQSPLKQEIRHRIKIKKLLFIINIISVLF